MSVWKDWQLQKINKIIKSSPTKETLKKELLNTFDYLEVAEFTANSLVMAATIGTLQPIGDEEIEDLRIAFNVK